LIRADQLFLPRPPTPITAMFNRLDGEQLIRFGIRNAPAVNADDILIKSLLVGFIVGLYLKKFYSQYLETYIPHIKLCVISTFPNICQESRDMLKNL
jgi:hypothetical protein